MKTLWNDNWQFMKCSVDTTFKQAMEKKQDMLDVSIPHDWLIYDSHHLYEDSTGWYRKEFTWQEEDGDMLITFDGVYMDCTIYVNQKEAGQWKYGYSSFTLNVTEFLEEGTNEIVVGVCHKGPNSRWYSGAGIYRNVWMRLVKDLYIEENGLYVHTEAVDNGYLLSVETNVVLERFLAKRAYETYATLQNGQKVTEIRKQMEAEATCAIEHTLVEKESGMRVPMISQGLYERKLVRGAMKGCSATGALSDECKTYGQRFFVEQPLEWDVDNPFCYELITRLFRNGELCDTLCTTIGFKTMSMDANHGLTLNGKRMKLQGVCEHHDLGALGAAFNKEAQRRKYKLLKEMGVNAIRFAHNMPAPECLELCDEMGFLAMDEAFDMWERPKTEYDYARFFGDWVERDMESFVRRDRNHVSLLFWSVGNEIHDTHADAERGKEITRMLYDLVVKYDPLRNAPITFGSNYLPWDNTQPSANLLDAVGYNYSEKYYVNHHGKYPERIIYGSETASIVYSRGIYHFPLSANILAEDDEQCSALGKSATSWGAKSFEALLCEDRDMEFSLGQFLWTGTDYIGEPTPYHTKNSYFGQIDTAGFPKDAYYVIQSAWVDYHKKPMIHIFPYWDFNEGQLIDVRVCSNAPVVELFFNGQSLGKQRLTHEVNSGNHIIADYQLAYATGTLTAVAYDGKGNVLCKEEKHSFKDPVKLVLTPDKNFLESADDIQCITITAVDEDGHVVENATNRVKLEVGGAGKLVGLDNGDSTDFDSYKGNSKRLFSGKLLAMVQPSGEEGPIRISAAFDQSEIPVRKIEIAVKDQCAQSVLGNVADKDTHGVSGDAEEKGYNNNYVNQSACTDVDYVPKNTGVCVITPESGVVTATATLYPDNTTYKDVEWRAVNETGVEVNLVTLCPDESGKSVIIKPMGDGCFRLRCMSRSGDQDRYRIISDLEMKVEGFGPAFTDPYELVMGSLYTRSNGKEGAGNDKGVASATDGDTVITFDHLDFGNRYADEITMPLFTLNGEPYEIEIYEGLPEEGKLLGQVVYQKEMIWNVYQEDTWKLDRSVTGVTSLSFVFHNKVHMKGFRFTKEEKAYFPLKAVWAEAIYGDSFEKTETAVEKIGNNVSLLYTGMDFGDEGCSRIQIVGRAPKADNPIHIRFANGQEEIKQVVSFPRSEDYQAVSFDLENVKGKWDVSFVFMPGSCFDFESFRFA